MEVLKGLITEGSSTQPFPEQDEISGTDDEDACSGADVVRCNDEVEDSETDTVGVVGAKDVTFRVEDTETEQL